MESDIVRNPIMKLHCTVCKISPDSFIYFGKVFVLFWVLGDTRTFYFANWISSIGLTEDAAMFSNDDVISWNIHIHLSIPWRRTVRTWLVLSDWLRNLTFRSISYPFSWRNSDVCQMVFFSDAILYNMPNPAMERDQLKYFWKVWVTNRWLVLQVYGTGCAVKG